MIRIFDVFFSLIGLLFLSPIILILFSIYIFQGDNAIFKQSRLGQNQKIFFIYKFRTMRIDTKSVGTHLVDNKSITKFGHYLRLTKLDEIPQLLNVLKGDMSFVGPRPCLLNQKKLINERKKRGIYKVKPGITGLAQISGINMKTPTLLSKTDLKMINKMNLINYFYYILRTFLTIFK